MIKVNLLRDQTARARKPALAVEPEVSRTGLLLVALFGVLALGIGASWYYLNGQITVLKDRQTKLRAESERLRGLKKEMEAFEKLKKLRQSKIDVIEKLKESQTGPVLLLNHVIQSIPRDSALWLTVLEQKGDRISVGGYALRGEAIPSFMTNLSVTGFFSSVDLELLEEEKDAARFSLVCMSKRKVAAE